MSMRSWWLGMISRRLNPLTLRLAREGKSHGPMQFWIIRHVGRKSGTTYETPIMLAEVPDGFICELTYGPDVNWFRNIVAARGGTVVRGGVETAVGAPEPVDEKVALKAFGSKAIILRLLRRHEFRLLRAV
ncbi:hypothetical protein BH11ACT3_BH11ACT3_11030 [soil metagenome]